MAGLEDHGYIKLCAQLAALLSISISSARRKIEIAAAREGVKDLVARQEIALRLLEEAKSSREREEGATPNQLDELLEALAEEENFMVED